MVQPIHIQNVRVWWQNGDKAAFAEQDFYAAEIISVLPVRDAFPVDLRGYTIFPGLINAHDHLELNHYPRTKLRDRYENAHQWGEDVSGRLDKPPFRELRRCPLEDRLFIGGLKNLLCGATTVVHHNKPFKALFTRDFPVRVLKDYGWAHSLHFSTAGEIQSSFLAAAPDVRWFIHLAEGTDPIAASEYKQLWRLECAGKNTVLIHGVGMTAEDIAHAAPRISGLVACPTTNLYLLGRTADASGWMAAGGHAALGSDSRLTADGDLLDEMRCMEKVLSGENAAEMTLDMVTTEAARILNLPLRGMMGVGADADFIAIRTTDNDVQALCNARRADIALVVRGGVPQIGDHEIMAQFPHIRTVPATLDGVPKAIHTRLASRLSECTLSEPGFIVDGKAARSRLVTLFRRGVR